MVSIHASVKDATKLFAFFFKDLYSFNPRIRKGCDPSLHHYFETLPVSIHASVKDATVAAPLDRDAT